MNRNFIALALVFCTATAAWGQATQPTTQKSTVGTIAASAKDVTPLGKGSVVPAITVVGVDGKPFDFKAAIAKQPTVLIFYRGGWCPFCNRQMDGLQGIVGDLKAAGYQLLAISPDKSDELAKSIAKHTLTYTLLSDSSAGAICAFGLAFRVDDGTFSRYLTMGVDLEAASGEKHHVLPVPAVYILGTDGVIRFVHFDPDYTKRMDPALILTEARNALTKTQ